MVEVKPAGDEAWLTAESSQVSGYWEHYHLVLVTNTRDFVLLGEDTQGRPARDLLDQQFHYSRLPRN